MPDATTISHASLIEAWRAAAKVVGGADGAPYVTVVSAGTAWAGTAIEVRQLDIVAQALGLERPSSVAEMLLPSVVHLSTENAPAALNRGLKLLGRGRRSGRRFSQWIHTYFERMVGVWQDRHGVQKEIKPNRLLGVIEKLNAWDKNAEAAFYIHTDLVTDNFRKMGSPCLQYVQFRAHGDKKLSVVALYRAHDYANKALGNLIGLQRLGEFVAKHTARTYDGLSVVSLNPFSNSGKGALIKFSQDAV